jgi:hypothetical protein
MVLTGGKVEVEGEQPVRVQLGPPQVPKGLTWNRARAFALRQRRQTAQAMARPISVMFV